MQRSSDIRNPNKNQHPPLTPYPPQGTFLFLQFPCSKAQELFVISTCSLSFLFFFELILTRRSSSPSHRYCSFQSHQLPPQASPRLILRLHPNLTQNHLSSALSPSGNIFFSGPCRYHTLGSLPFLLFFLSPFCWLLLVFLTSKC